jgi:iron complex outermembrane receptor protein
MNYGSVAAAVSVAVSLAVGAALPAGSAWAQDAPAAQAGQDAQGDQAAAAAPGALQEVVVTAERRATDIQTTPISVAAITGGQLASQQVNTVADLQSTVPNFQALNAGPYLSVNIRGIGNTAITPTIVPGVAIFHDGLLAAETIFNSEPFYDIADVEVLRGPQGTFVGASSTGGAVQVNSANPNFRGVNGYIEGQYGNYQDEKVDGAVNLPVSDTFAMRLAFNWEQMKSFSTLAPPTPLPSDTADVPGSVNNHNARLGMLWKPSDSFQALLKIEFNYVNPYGDAAEPNQNTFTIPAGQLCPGGYAGPVCHSLYYPYSSHQPFVLTDNIPLQTEATYMNRYGLELRETLPNGIVLRSLTGFQYNNQTQVQDPDDSSANYQLEYKNVGPEDNYLSQEFNIISPTTGPVTWIAGASLYYRDTDVETTNYIAYPSYSPSVPLPQGDFYPVGPGGTTITHSGSDSVQRTVGVFGNVDWQFTRTLQLEIGARGNWDANYSKGQPGFWPGVPAGDSSVRQIPVTTGTPCPDNPGYSCVYSAGVAQQTDSVPTGKIDLNWTPLPGQFFYAFWARGYKSGGVIIGTSNGFKPEQVDDYELGWKSNSFNRHLQTSIGGYWMQYHDMQLPALNILTGGNLTTNLSSPSTIRGIEASADGRFGAWDANLALALDDSRMGALSEVATYRLPAAASGLKQCAGGAAPPLCFDYSPYEVSVAGEQNPYTPKVTVNASIDYNFHIKDAILTPKVAFNYTASQYDSIFQQGDYYKLGARELWNLSLNLVSGPWTAQAYCNNCGNWTYVTAAGGTNVGDVWFYGAPRQYGVRFNYAFAFNR